jgi:uncharacterized membrane protein
MTNVSQDNEPGRLFTWLPLLLTGVAVAAFVVRVWLAWDRLPVQMASHFDFSGQPNDWMSKPAFFALDALVIAVIATIPLWIRVLPAQVINLPIANRGYWLAPQRRKESLRRMALWINWLTCLCTLFLLFTLEQAVRASLNDGRLWGEGPALVAFLLLMAGWALAFYRKFQPPPETSSR